MTNPGRARRRSIRLVAAAAVVGLTSTAIVAAGGGSASAADLPKAQSVGNFLDATLGGNTLDAIAKLDYAKAKAPGSNGVQNPLDVTAVDAINLPLTGALQLPQIAGINLGAANQVAKANVNGSSYGASGLVSNSGGISVGGDNNAAPAAATIKLSASALTANSPVTLPGGANALDTIGSVTAAIGAVAAKASTPKGFAKPGATEYGIAGLDLALESPLLGGLLGQLTSGAATVNGLLAPVRTLLSGLNLLPANCALVTGVLPSKLSLDSNGVTGVVTIDATNGKLTVSLDKLLKSLGLDLNDLPANTDLIKYVTDNLGDIVTKGVAGLVNALLNTVGGLVTSCTPATLVPGLQVLLDALTTGITTLTTPLGSALTQVTGALSPVLDQLNQLIDIGVNVQPNGKAGTYTDPLAATAKQGTEVVDGQTVVRAIEVNIAGAAGNGGLLNLALANAAAGPSTFTAPPTTTVPTTTVPTTDVPSTIIPTGVPAGAAGHGDGGLPVLPLVALLMLLSVAGGSYWHLRVRGAGSH